MTNSKKIYDGYRELKNRLATDKRYGEYRILDIEDNGLMRNIIEIPVNDGLRGGIISENQAIIKEWDTIGELVRRAVIMLREDGGIFLLPKVRIVVSHRNANPSHFDVNPLSPTYLQPFSISITGTETEIPQSEYIYIMLGGNEEYQEINNIGLSMTKMLNEPVERYISSLDISTGILQQLNQDVIKMNDLHDKMDDEEQAIMERLEFISRLKSNHSILLLDGEDDFISINKTLSGANQVIEANALEVCQTAKIPFSRLFGKGSGGLTGNGESELKLYYDTVVSSIQHLATEIFNIFTEDKYKGQYEFPEIYTRDAVEKANTLKLNTDTVTTLLEQDLITSEDAIKILGI